MPELTQTKPKWGDFVIKDGKQLKYFPVHEAQQRILTSAASRRLFLGGVGSGKSSCGALDLLNHISANPTATYLVVAPTTKILESATIPTWERTVKGTEFDAPYRYQRSVVELPQGGMIYFRSCYDSKGSYTGSFEGIQVGSGGNGKPGLAWVDEAGQMPHSAWSAIVRRCASHNARIILTTTPYTLNWLKRDFFDKATAGNANYDVVRCRSIDNPGFNREAIEDIQNTTRNHEFKMFYEAEWAQGAGLIYPDHPNWLVDELPANLAGEWEGGIDFGFNDSFAALAGVVDHNDTLWLCYERYIKGKDIMEHGEALAKLPVDIRWFCDSANPDQIKLLKRRFGLNARPVKKGTGSVSYGINLVTFLGKSGKVKIDRTRCPNLVIEMESYCYSEHEGELIDKIKDGQKDHACDSFRYLCSGRFRRSLAQPNYASLVTSR